MDFISLFHKGGIIMYPILLASVIAIMITCERHFFYKKAKSDIGLMEAELPEKLKRQEFPAAEEICRRAGGLAAVVLLNGLKNIHYRGCQHDVLEGAANRSAYDLKQYLNWLSVIVTMAPLLGLLGTVLGMVQSFGVLAIAEGAPFAITGGVGEALIATATGLIVAILALTLHTCLLHKANTLIADIEYASTIYLTAIAGGENEN